MLGGYFSDRIGGQRVIFVAAIFWSLITFWMPNILQLPSRQWYYSIPFIVTVRILNGAFQGVHFPAMSSITSQVNTTFNHQPTLGNWHWNTSLPEFMFQWTVQFFQPLNSWFSIGNTSNWNFRIICIRLLRMANVISCYWIFRYCVGVNDAILYNVSGSQSNYKSINAESPVYE